MYIISLTDIFFGVFHFVDIVALIANTTGIPHMQYDWNIEIDLEQHKMNHRMTVNVAPPLAKLSRAYLDIIKANFEWKKFTIYYETKQGNNMIN